MASTDRHEQRDAHFRVPCRRGGAEDLCLSHSSTAVARGGELGQLRTDRLISFVTGREPLSAWDQFVRDWRGRGGEQIRKEYEEALWRRVATGIKQMTGGPSHDKGDPWPSA
jgi:putative aldouronate transport system substrate-binding protein